LSKAHTESQIQSIYKKIRERICLFQYQPGEMLSENALANEFGVSRTPMRRILRQLEFEGLVSSQQGVGTLITTIDLKTLKEIYMLRIKLAELIGELSPTPSQKGDISILEQLGARCDTMHTERDYEELGRINMEFNNALVCFISSKPLREISDRLYYQTARIWPQILPDMDWSEEVDYMCTEIKQIIAALHDNDMKQVGLIRRDHISMSLSRIQRYLGEGNIR